MVPQTKLWVLSSLDVSLSLMSLPTLPPKTSLVVVRTRKRRAV